MKHFYPSLKAISLWIIISVSLLTGTSTLASEDSIKFYTAPTHPKAITEDIYTPILSYLSKKTGKKIELMHTNSFLEYTLKMRKNAFDIAFDGPHFASWRIKKMGDTPLVRLQGQVQVLLAIPKSEEKFTELSQLAGHKICAFPSPNLLTMALLNHFKNPMRQPILVNGKGFKGLQKCQKDNKGKAMVLRKQFWNKMDQSNYKLLLNDEKTFPERTFTVSSAIDNRTKQAITSALLSPEATPHLQRLLKTFKKKALIETNLNEYEGIYQLLAPVWGFKID